MLISKYGAADLNLKKNAHETKARSTSQVLTATAAKPLANEYPESSHSLFYPTY